MVMERIEKTVFISYRRTNIAWALAVFQNLTQHGYDAFLDYEGIASGDFEGVILGNVAARAHFVVVLTPSALERCGDATDWLRREIETALARRRNIVPLMLEGFGFDAPGISRQLTGELAQLARYNGLKVPAEYFGEAMERLRSRFLNVPLSAVLHPASASALRFATQQKAAADAAPAVQEEELTAQEWFERGFEAVDSDEKIRLYSEAIRLKPNFVDAFNNRGAARSDAGDVAGARRDYDEALRLQPKHAEAFLNRGNLRCDTGDWDGALQDYSKAIDINPGFAMVFYNRGSELSVRGDEAGALRDFNEAIRLKPDYVEAFNNRGISRRAVGDLDGALRDYDEAIRLKPNLASGLR